MATLSSVPCFVSCLASVVPCSTYLTSPSQSTQCFREPPAKAGTLRQANRFFRSDRPISYTYCPRFRNAPALQFTVKATIGTEVSTGWKTKDDSELTMDNFVALCNNEIPSIKIKSVLTPEQCDAALAVIKDYPFTDYAKFNPPLAMIGVTHYDFGPQGRDTYLGRAPDSGAFMRALASRGIDIRQIVMDRFRDIYTAPAPAGYATGRREDVQVAAEQDGRTYFSFLTAKINDGAGVHADWAPAATSSDWRIHNINFQLGFEVFLTDFDKGETIVYEKQYDDWMKGRDPKEVVSGSPYKLLDGNKGDLIMWNTRNFHELLPAAPGKDRICVTTFFGVDPDGRWLFWY